MLVHLTIISSPPPPPFKPPSKMAGNLPNVETPASAARPYPARSLKFMPRWSRPLDAVLAASFDFHHGFSVCIKLHCYVDASTLFQIQYDSLFSTESHYLSALHDTLFSTEPHYLSALHDILFSTESFYLSALHDSFLFARTSFDLKW